VSSSASGSLSSANRCQPQARCKAGRRSQRTSSTSTHGCRGMSLRLDGGVPGSSAGAGQGTFAFAGVSLEGSSGFSVEFAGVGSRLGPQPRRLEVVAGLGRTVAYSQSAIAATPGPPPAQQPGGGRPRAAAGCSCHVPWPKSAACSSPLSWLPSAPGSNLCGEFWPIKVQPAAECSGQPWALRVSRSALVTSTRPSSQHQGTPMKAIAGPAQLGLHSGITAPPKPAAGPGLPLRVASHGSGEDWGHSEPLDTGWTYAPPGGLG